MSQAAGHGLLGGGGELNNTPKKVYIAGKITGNPGFEKQFKNAEMALTKQGHAVMNPAALGQGGFEHKEYMHVSYAMIDVCDVIYLLENWKDSKGACLECGYASAAGKEIIYQEEGVKA
jgi:nucleoside 2-deoxyribosyltransferase